MHADPICLRRQVSHCNYWLALAGHACTTYTEKRLRKSINDSIVYLIVMACRSKSIIGQTRPFALRSAQFTEHFGLDKPKRKRAKHPRVARELEVVANNIAMSVWYLYPHRQLVSMNPFFLT